MKCYVPINHQNGPLDIDGVEQAPLTERVELAQKIWNEFEY